MGGINTLTGMSTDLKLPGALNESESHSVMSDSFQHNGLYSPWNSPRKNTGVGSLSLLQGIFPTQGLNPYPFCLFTTSATWGSHYEL